MSHPDFMFVNGGGYYCLTCVFALLSDEGSHMVQYPYPATDPFKCENCGKRVSLNGTSEVEAPDDTPTGDVSLSDYIE